MRVSMPAEKVANIRIGEAIALGATLEPPREPVEPGGFDFGRRAWFDRLGAAGYATSKITLLSEVAPAPLDVRIWASIDVPRRSIAADQADEPPLHPHAVGTKDARLVARIGGFERDGVAAPPQAFQRCFGFVHKGHNDIAVIGVLAFLHNDGVAFEDAGLDHGIAFDLERIMLALTEKLGRYFDGTEPCLDCVDWHAGSDPAHDRDAHGLGQALAIANLRHTAEAA